MTILLGCTLTAWFLLSITAQLPLKVFPRVPWVRRFLKPVDPFGLIPRWTFFAPNPGIHDHHLLFRAGPDDSHFSPWREFDLISNSSLLRFVWNPLKRERKCFSDNVSTLLRELRFCVINKRPQAIQISPSYLIFLNAASVVAQGEKYVQFTILRSNGDQNALPLFLSYIHEVEPWS